MVHRTDIAGSVGSGIGQVNPDLGRTRRRAPIGALGISGGFIEKNHFPEIYTHSCFGGMRRSRRFMTAIPSVHAVDVDAPGQVDRHHVKRHHQEHCGGRDGNAIEQT